MLKLDIKFIHLAFILALTCLLLSPIGLQAQAVSPEKVDLTLNVLGAYPNTLKAGQDNRVFLEIRNNGTTPVTNIRLSSNAPDGWTVEFQPATLDSLAAGGTSSIDLNIIPSSSAGRTDFNLTLLAEANETRAVNVLYVQVEGGISYWVWVGIGLGILVIIGFIIVYIRFGKS